MKYLNLLILLLAVHVVDYSFEDSNGDRSKEIITIHYSNGASDKLVLDKKLIDSSVMYQQLDEIAAKRVQ